jgi:hypothetical protein
VGLYQVTLPPVLISTVCGKNWVDDTLLSPPPVFTLTTSPVVRLFRVLALVKSLAEINFPETNSGPEILVLTTTNNIPVTIAIASAPVSKTNLLFILSLTKNEGLL